MGAATSIRTRLAIVAIAILSAGAPAAAKDKGLPSSPEREVYCAGKFADCITEAGDTCSSTYDRPDHVGACIQAENARCAEAYGRSSSCVTSPRTAPDLSPPTAPGGVVHEPRPVRPGRGPARGPGEAR